jgi:hypothetical protein
MNWKAWLKGLAAAAAGGATTTTTGVLINWANTAAQTGTAPKLSGSVLGILAAAGAIPTAIAYLMQSPNKPEVK